MCPCVVHEFFVIHLCPYQASRLCAVCINWKSDMGLRLMFAFVRLVEAVEDVCAICLDSLRSARPSNDTNGPMPGAPEFAPAPQPEGGEGVVKLKKCMHMYHDACVRTYVGRAGRGGFSCPTCSTVQCQGNGPSPRGKEHRVLKLYRLGDLTCWSVFRTRRHLNDAAGMMWPLVSVFRRAPSHGRTRLPRGYTRGVPHG